MTEHRSKEDDTSGYDDYSKYVDQRFGSLRSLFFQLLISWLRRTAIIVGLAWGLAQLFDMTALPIFIAIGICAISLLKDLFYWLQALTIEKSAKRAFLENEKEPDQNT